MSQCPCGSSSAYEDCCLQFHSNLKHPSSCLELMKSRYSAYVKEQPLYLIETTHTTSLHYKKNRFEWLCELQEVCRAHKFLNLTIVDHNESGSKGRVHFKVSCTANQKDASFEEKSRFVLEDQKWYYIDGQTK